MARRAKHRHCRRDASGLSFKPRGIPAHKLQVQVLNLDEFEAMRLCDLEGLEQIEAGKRMGISRGTVQRLLVSGRKKLIDAIVSRKTIEITHTPSCCETTPCDP
ncbi:MAG: DUF134 domain-containing protein [Fibrobacter sp.]|nr:DUF134 domain-containing protein [Fibrobacter sp.]